MKARLIDHIVLSGGRQRLTLETDEDIRGLYDELKEGDTRVDIRKWHRPRSLDANAYFHVLVNRIAYVTASSDDDVKRDLVVKYGSIARDADGGIVAAKLPASVDIATFYPYARCYKTEDEDGRSFNCYIFYKRTRELDSAEMSHLIDGTVSECKALGIETMTPDQLASLMEAYNERFGGK